MNYDYRWVVRDPLLNNAIVLDEFEASEEFENSPLEHGALQVRTLKVFLEKYGLTVQLLDSDNKIVDLSKVVLADDGHNTQITVLPFWQDIEPTYDMWVGIYPWMTLVASEGAKYPLYWQYSREIRKESLLDTA